jgi:hypothetical protein
MYRRISTSFGPTGPSSGEFTQLFTQPLVQWLYRSGRALYVVAGLGDLVTKTSHNIQSILLLLLLLLLLFWRYSPCWSLFCSNFKSFCFFMGLVAASRPTPNLEDHGIRLCPGHYLWPAWKGRPYQQLSYRQHSSQEHLTVQAPQLCQSIDTFPGGEGWFIAVFVSLHFLKELKCVCSDHTSVFSVRVCQVAWLHFSQLTRNSRAAASQVHRRNLAWIRIIYATVTNAFDDVTNYYWVLYSISS